MIKTDMIAQSFKMIDSEDDMESVHKHSFLWKKLVMESPEQKPHIVGIGGTYRSGSTSLWSLKRALEAAAHAGATTELVDLGKLDLPMFRPHIQLGDFGSGAEHLVAAVRRAGGLLLSSAAYHGTLAGITKNALDYFEFLSGGERPYLAERTVGLIATAGGDMAGVNAANAMVHVVHSLRGNVAPLIVSIPNAGRSIGLEGESAKPCWIDKLDKLGELVVEMTVVPG